MMRLRELSTGCAWAKFPEKTPRSNSASNYARVKALCRSWFAWTNSSQAPLTKARFARLSLQRREQALSLIPSDKKGSDHAQFPLGPAPGNHFPPCHSRVIEPYGAPADQCEGGACKLGEEIAGSSLALIGRRPIRLNDARMAGGKMIPRSRPKRKLRMVTSFLVGGNKRKSLFSALQA